MSKENETVIRHSLTRMLARREHGFFEVLHKLVQKGFSEDDILPVLQAFQQADLQSDARFAASVTNNAISKGQGTNRIKEQLKSLRVNNEVIQMTLTDADADWFELARAVKTRKFGTAPANDFKQRARQQRFLAYRGFTNEQIQYALTYCD